LKIEKERAPVFQRRTIGQNRRLPTVVGSMLGWLASVLRERQSKPTDTPVNISWAEDPHCDQTALRFATKGLLSRP
jgi:hypothetical protein